MCVAYLQDDFIFSFEYNAQRNPLLGVSFCAPATGVLFDRTRPLFAVSYEFATAR